MLVYQRERVKATNPSVQILASHKVVFSGFVLNTSPSYVLLLQLLSDKRIKPPFYMAKKQAIEACREIIENSLRCWKTVKLI